MDWNNPEKSGTIPDDAAEPHGYVVKDLSPKDEPISHQVVGRVKAYQAYDG